MFSSAISAFKGMVTEKDNLTHDMGKWSWLICTASVLAHDGYQLFKDVKSVSVKDLAFSLAAIATAHGIAIGAKSSTEHPPQG
jgi:hypothetical protein